MARLRPGVKAPEVAKVYASIITLVEGYGITEPRLRRRLVRQVGAESAEQLINASRQKRRSEQ